MHSSLAAVVLCICAQTVAAQCVDTNLPVRDARTGLDAITAGVGPVNGGVGAINTGRGAITAGVGPISAGVEVIKTSAATPAAPQARTGGELIKTAAASTRDVPGTPPVVRDTSARMQGDEEDHPRNGTAMLLAALAVMSGIALRRFGANNQ